MHYLAEYQTFSTTEELNNAVYTHIKRNSYDLNETDRSTLKAIARYAVKFSGAAHLKAETIAILIGKSVKTARRTINKLDRLEIVKKIATTRKVSGGKGANIIVILPVDDGEARMEPVFQDDVQSTMTSREDGEGLTESNAELTKITEEPSHLIKRSKKHLLDTTIPSNALKDVLPNEVYNAMARYFNAEDIYQYYGILLRAKASVDSTVMIEDDPEPYIEAWNATILKVKQGKIRRLSDYLYVSFRQATLTVLRRRNLDRLRNVYEF